MHAHTYIHTYTHIHIHIHTYVHMKVRTYVYNVLADLGYLISAFLEADQIILLFSYKYSLFCLTRCSGSFCILLSILRDEYCTYTHTYLCKIRLVYLRAQSFHRDNFSQHSSIFNSFSSILVYSLAEKGNHLMTLPHYHKIFTLHKYLCDQVYENHRYRDEYKILEKQF